MEKLDYVPSCGPDDLMEHADEATIPACGYHAVLYSLAPLTEEELDEYLDATTRGITGPRVAELNEHLAGFRIVPFVPVDADRKARKVLGDFLEHVSSHLDDPSIRATISINHLAENPLGLPAGLIALVHGRTAFRPDAQIHARAWPDDAPAWKWDDARTTELKKAFVNPFNCTPERIKAVRGGW